MKSYMTFVCYIPMWRCINIAQVWLELEQCECKDKEGKVEKVEAGGIGGLGQKKSKKSSNFM